MFWNNRKEMNWKGTIKPRRFTFERLEDRRVLAFDFAPEQFVPESPEEQAIADEVGTELAWLYSDFVDWEAAGGAEEQPFETFSPAVQQVGFAVDELSVSIEAYAEQDAASIRDDLNTIGFQELASFGRGLTGWLPIASIDSLAETSGLLFARITHGFVTNVGNTDTQGDAAQSSDDVRTMLSVDGSGITVGVISDSYDISASAGGSAAQDVTTGDLPAGVNVLDDSLNPNQVIDEGRAMLQLVHDVAPGAGLAFHTAGVSQIAMASSIGDLETAGSDVIVDDIIFLAEPMFQDGVIAQAADTAEANGVPYFSAAGNQARRSYESAFNAGTPVMIGGVPETPHEFDTVTNDILQRVTVPIGGLFRVSFQWDSPSASAGGAGANNNLNIYLVAGGTTIVAQGRANNIGADAVEIPIFANNTGTTQFDVLITSAGGPLPGTIKYVDFGIGTTFNEYLTNSSTLFGHANADGAIAVGAASFLDTPPFGTNPPVIENFSALGGTPILFDTAGNALGTPEVRNKADIVGPDGGNTTFFGTDIAGDADSFPNFFGTSAAAPHVSALAALLLQVNPDLSPSDVSTILESTAIDMDDPVAAGFQTGFDFATGLGLVDGTAAADTTLATRGDFDRDQDVDGADFLLWQRTVGSAAIPVGSGADGDLSGTVGSGDLAIWQSNYGETIPAPLVAAIQPAVAEVVNQSAVSTVEVADNLPSTSIEVGESSLGSFPIHLFATAFPSTETEVVAEKPVSVETRSPQPVDFVIAELTRPSERLALEVEREKAEPIDAVFESIEEVLLEAYTAQQN